MSIGFYFSSFVIIGAQLCLMMYIFMLQPRLWINRLFAVYMLILSVGSYSVLVSSTTTDVAVSYTTSQLHALTTMVLTPLLWLLILGIFIPRHHYRKRITVFLIMLALLPVSLAVLDVFLSTRLLFVFDTSLYARGYVSVREVLNGRIGTPLYFFYITISNSLLVFPLTFFAFRHSIPERLRRAARILLLLTISVGVLYVPWLHIPIQLRSMLTPVFAAVGAAWVVSSYRFFSPMEMAMTQVVDTVSIGLLVFDEQMYLSDANAFSEEYLPFTLAQDQGTLTLPQLLQRLMPDVENAADLQILQLAVQQRPTQIHQLEIIRRNNADKTADIREKTWLQFSIRPVYDNEIYIGLACLVENLTMERRTQAYIAETHQTIEQYAYNQMLLNEITKASISISDFSAALSILASRLVGLFEADNCFISLWDEELQRARPAIAYGVDETLYYSLELADGEPSITYEVCQRKQPIVIEDAYNSPFISSRIAQMFPTRAMLALPMITQERIVGALLVGFNTPRKFSSEEIKWGEQIAQQMTLAIAKNQLFAVEKEQRIFLESLQKAGQALTSTLDFEQVLDLILEEIAHVVPYDMASFALIEKDEAYMVRHHDFGEFDLNRDTAFRMETLIISEMPTLQKMYKTKRPLRISNTDQSEDWRYPGHVKSWMGVPLLIEDEPIAFLMVDKLELNFYQLQHEKRLAAFANYATLALKHARLFTEIQRRVTELEALSTVSAAFRFYETVPTILEAVLQTMVETLSAKMGVAFLLNEDGSAVVSQASYPAEFYPAGIEYLLGEGITGGVAKTGRIHISANINEDPEKKDKPNEPGAIKNLHSTIALPLTSKRGVLGVIHLGLDTFHEFVEDEIRTMRAMSNIAANGLQRIQLMQTLEARVASRTFDLETANERLKELDKLKTKFIADVSHELRTPVANLSIYINLLASGNPKKQAHYINVLQQQIDRLTNLVEATLGLSRLEIDADNQVLTAVDLTSLAQEVVEGHRGRAEAFGLRIINHLQPELPLLLGDKNQLDQLITNLITNAINYNDGDGQITVSTFVTDEEKICLQVADDGMGIDETEIPHLFDRFYRGQRAGQSNIPGTGLGLAIVKEIVDLHHGEITVQSHPGQGAIFTVLFPLYQHKVVSLLEAAQSK
ncbi:MAG: GAF domain-containing protein [Ardenticatenaceae bacterium]|nr:GAF domain-containing protein [Ardenticatenaceae bacterium]